MKALTQIMLAGHAGYHLHLDPACEYDSTGERACASLYPALAPPPILILYFLSFYHVLTFLLSSCAPLHHVFILDSLLFPSPICSLL